MIGFCAEYAFTRVKRLVFQTAVVGLVALAFSFAVCYARIAERQQRAELETVAAETLVFGEITDFTGRKVEGLNIYGAADMFSPPGILSVYVKDVLLRRGIRFDTDDFTAGLFMRKPEELRAVAVSAVAAADSLRRETGAVITWFDGYDETIFAGRDNVCLVPWNVNDFLEVGESGEKVIILTLVDYIGNEKSELTIELAVAGFFSGGGQDVFMPWLTLIKAFEEDDGWWSAHSEMLRFTVSDNSKIGEFKELAYTFFGKPDPWGAKSGNSLALAVYDEAYDDAVRNGQNSVVVTKRFIKAILAAALLLGFVIGFLRARVRRTELCVLNVIGMSGGKLLLSAQFELLFVFAPCGIIGVLACLISRYEWFAADDALLALACLIIYAVGNFVTIAVMLRLNSAEILKGREIE